MKSLESKHSLCVTPIIGWIRPSIMAEPSQLSTNTTEVECAFAVPLKYFADPANVVREERVKWRGEEFAMRTYHYHDMDEGGEDDGGDFERQKFVIWGLTAYIVRHIAKLAYGSDEDDD
jgi:hypothetical protein